MGRFSRRDFVTHGFSIAGASAAGVVLLGDAAPTEASGDLDSYGRYLQERIVKQAGAQKQPVNWNVTEANILGPFHREGAPFRCKVTPPLEPGTILLISGRVWGHDTRKPLPNTVIDIWQASAQGRYDNDDPKNPPAAGVFKNRARLIADEQGYYEFETIHPGPYRIDKNTWRPSHIHYWIRCTGYRPLITQLYFRGDQHQKGDQWIRDSLIIDLTERKGPGGTTYRTGTFNIVLAPQPRQ
jgi:protocatechuate 3,4-dioxygenase beta subunit